jgi:hypothetical protein
MSEDRITGWDELNDDQLREELIAWLACQRPATSKVARAIVDVLELIVPDGPSQMAALLLALKHLERTAPAGYPVLRFRAALTAWVEERAAEVDLRQGSSGKGSA